MRHLLRTLSTSFIRMLVLFTVGLGILVALVIALLIFALITHSGWHVRFSFA